MFDLLPYNKEESSKVLIQINKWQRKLLQENNSRIVYPADEFYIMADCDIPEYEEYEDFPQLENGVGLVSLFRHEFYEHLSRLKNPSSMPTSVPISVSASTPNRTVSIATGISAYKFIKELADKLKKRYNNIKVNIYPIENKFFGKHVTVVGLLTAQDIINELKGKELGQELIIPETMLKAGEDKFLDDYTVDMVKEILGVKLRVVKADGESFINGILGKTDI